MPSLHPNADLRRDRDEESLAALLGPIPHDSFDRVLHLHVMETVAPLGDFAEGGWR